MTAFHGGPKSNSRGRTLGSCSGTTTNEAGLRGRLRTQKRQKQRRCAGAHFLVVPQLQLQLVHLLLQLALCGAVPLHATGPPLGLLRRRGVTERPEEPAGKKQARTPPYKTGGYFFPSELLIKIFG